MHGSNSFLNLKLTLQAFFYEKMVEAGETATILFGRRDPAQEGVLETAPTWMSFRVVDGGNWESTNPGLLQVIIYTRLSIDPYEIELDRLTDVVKDILDVFGGLELKDYRTDRLNPTPVVDPVHEEVPIRLNIRHFDMDEVPPPAGTNEMLNGRALSFRVYFWRHSRTGV